MDSTESRSRSKDSSLHRRNVLTSGALLISLLIPLQAVKSQQQASCDFGGKRDIVFFLDNSSSVDPAEFDSMRTAIESAVRGDADGPGLLTDAADAERTRITVVNYGCKDFATYSDCAVSGGFFRNPMPQDLMWSNNRDDFLKANLCRTYAYSASDHRCDFSNLTGLETVDLQSRYYVFAQSAYLSLRHLLFGAISGGEPLSPGGGPIQQRLESLVREDAVLIVVQLTDESARYELLVRNPVENNPLQTRTFYRFSNELKNNHGAKIITVGVPSGANDADEVRKQLSAIASRADSDLAAVDGRIGTEDFYDFRHDCNDTDQVDNPGECNGILYSPNTSPDDVLRNADGEVVQRMALFIDQFDGGKIGAAIKSITDEVRIPGITLSSAPNPSQTGEEVTLSAALSGAAPGEEIAFYAGVGTVSPIQCFNTGSERVPLVSVAGSTTETTAQCRTRFDTPGTQTLTIAYLGCEDLDQVVTTTSQHETLPRPLQLERIFPPSGAAVEEFGGKRGVRFAITNDEVLDVTQDIELEIRADGGVGNLALSVEACTVIDGAVRCPSSPTVQGVSCDVATRRCDLNGLPAGESRTFFLELFSDASNVQAVVTVQGRDVATLPLP